MAKKTPREFRDNEISVIRARRFGYEQASYALLARVFDTTPQHISRICCKPKEEPFPGGPK